VNGPEGRQPDPEKAILDQPAVALARDLVEDHARHRDPRVVAAQPSATAAADCA
jgi:hypothetical protein